MIMDVKRATEDQRETEMSEQTTGQEPKVMQARFASRCTLCGKQIRAGQMITWSREQGARCTTRRSDYTTDPRHPEMITVAAATVASQDVESAEWTKAEDRGDHEPMFRVDTFDAI